MTLVDTSAWVEFLRGTGSAADDFVHHHLGAHASVTEPVMMELVAGARPGSQARGVERLLASQSWHHVDPLLDFAAAAEVFALTRTTGHSPRSLQDCLIAAVALRVGVPIAHRDADYEHIAHATGLQVIDLRD